jgi:hypothetical protein
MTRFTIYQKVFRASFSSTAKGIVATELPMGVQFWSNSIENQEESKDSDL